VIDREKILIEKYIDELRAKYLTKHHSYLSKYLEIAVVFGGEEAKRRFYADHNMNPDVSATWMLPHQEGLS